MADARRDPKVLAFLRWLHSQGGSIDAEHKHLDRWSGDRESTDTLNLAFEAKLAVQCGSEDDFTLHLLPAGLALVAPAQLRDTAP